MKQTAKNNRLWEEVRGLTGWHRTGQLMLHVGHFDQTAELYQELLENASTDSDRAHIYHHLGYLKNDQGKYPVAANFFKKSLEIERKNLPEDDASLAPTYSNIGLVYKNMGEHSKSLEFTKKQIKSGKYLCLRIIPIWLLPTTT
ncbi:unnamed protein product [Rotaria magnacalcarata]|nr:unnamed protein product [Rotaria magnacalcarata]